MLASDFVNDALADIGVTAPGETATTDEQAYALRLINQVLASWSAEALPIYQITRSTVTLNGAASYALNTRPVKIKSADIAGDTGLIVSTRIVNAEQWAAGDGMASLPALYHDGGFPTGTVFLRPAPLAGTLEIYSYMPFAQFASLATDIAFPPGYQLALRHALGLEVATGFGRTLPQQKIDLAVSAKMSIQGLNAAVLGTPVPHPPAAAA